MQSEQDLEGGLVTLHLLDSAEGHALQTWKFENAVAVKIGRSGDCDVTLADSRVSRLHAELHHRDGKWSLRSHGRNGTLVGGADVAEVQLKDGNVIQLGPNGPALKFNTVTEEDSTMATVENFELSGLDFLDIDEERKAAEVKQIVDTEAFRELQERARLLKQGRDEFVPDTKADG